ncbi:MAG: ankyrin repeat protein, partial [Rickettsiales bacterium]
QVAAESGNIELVRCFIDLKWGRAMYHEGKDPAYYAVLNDRRDVVDLLLDNPTQINRQYEDGSRLIHIAVLDNNPEMTSLLLAKGADVNKTYRGENTPLHLSAHLGFPDLAEILIESGASVFLRNRDGHKPIDLAADGSEVKIILQNRELEINQANNIICAITSPRTNPRLAGAQNMTQNIPEALLKILKTTLVGRH